MTDNNPSTKTSKPLICNSNWGTRITFAIVITLWAYLQNRTYLDGFFFILVYLCEIYKVSTYSCKILFPAVVVVTKDQPIFVMSEVLSNWK